LALTAYAMAGDDTKCRNAGCNGYLTKPIDREVFLPAIAERLKPVPTRGEPLPEVVNHEL
jgi:two-component system sensor kinase